MDVLHSAGLLNLALSLTYIQGIVVGVLGFIVALGLAIFIHELGHFLAAKLFKVPVERFVIGFDKEAMGFLPRCIWERKIGETTYGLSLIPLGGYVKMSGVVHPDIERYLEGEPTKEEEKKAAREGEEPPHHVGMISSQYEIPGVETSAEDPSGDDKSLTGQAMGDMAALYKKPFWQKVIIYGAGVFMNMVLAVFIMGFLFSIGFFESAPYKARIAWIAGDSPFADTILEPGDHIIAVNGTAVETEADVMNAINAAAGGKVLGEDIEELPLEFSLARKDNLNETYTFDLTLTDDEELNASFFDVFFRRDAYIDFVLPNTPADKADLKEGDTIVAINGEPIEDWSHFRHVVSGSPNEALEIDVERNGEIVTVTLVPWEDADQPGVGQVGVIVGNLNKVRVAEAIPTAFAKAPGRVYTTTVNYVKRLGQLGGKLSKGNVKAVSRELGGPVGIGQIAYQMAQKGFADWLRFVIMLNVALAVMNILPFPVLDGGHIVFAAFEAVFRRPVPAQILVPILNGAVIMILILFVLVTFNDVRKLFF